MIKLSVLTVRGGNDSDNRPPVIPLGWGFVSSWRVLNYMIIVYYQQCWKVTTVKAVYHVCLNTYIDENIHIHAQQTWGDKNGDSLFPSNSALKRIINSPRSHILLYFSSFASTLYTWGVSGGWLRGQSLPVKRLGYEKFSWNSINENHPPKAPNFQRVLQCSYWKGD